MTLDLRVSLAGYADWVRVNDAHASHRLALLDRAERLLAGEEAGSDAQRREVAAKLERWRYQHLKDVRGMAACGGKPAEGAGPGSFGEDPTCFEVGLPDALDLAANELAGRARRRPRAAWTVIANPHSEEAPLAEAFACLDPACPLEEVTLRAAKLTREHFGSARSSSQNANRQNNIPPQKDGISNGEQPDTWRVLLYAPLYLSNECTNFCTYCGFRYPNAIERRHLKCGEALGEAEILQGWGFGHVLLVAGDHPGLASPDYFAEILEALKARRIEPGIEIAPQSTEAYGRLVDAGACGVTLYQETYQPDLYARYHPRGTKASFDWRLEGLERAAEAGMGRLGLGVLLGLADPRDDLTALVRHGRYLESRFPNRTLAFSLPRIHEAPEGFKTPFPVDDETFLRAYCTLRMAFPRAELVLSTRERATLRNRLARICITQMSAGSCTSPGGYEQSDAARKSGEQFPVCDHRSPAAVATWLSERGFQVAWNVPG